MNDFPRFVFALRLALLFDTSHRIEDEKRKKMILTLYSFG